MPCNFRKLNFCCFCCSQMISTLAMFLNPAERRCCVYLAEDGETPGYEKDLFLQGFLKVGVLYM